MKFKENNKIWLIDDIGRSPDSEMVFVSSWIKNLAKNKIKTMLNLVKNVSPQLNISEKINFLSFVDEILKFLSVSIVLIVFDGRNQIPSLK